MITLKRFDMKLKLSIDKFKLHKNIIHLRVETRAEQSLVKTVNQTEIYVFGLVYGLNGLVWFFYLWITVSGPV